MPAPRFSKKMFLSLFFGGILPIIAFTVIEDRFGTGWGLAAGMFLGAGEVIWEWWRRGKVDPMTWGGNGMILVLGGISLVTQDGIWFKLQPAIIECAFGIALCFSVSMKRPLLNALAAKQGLQTATHVALPQALRGMTLRMGLFFLVHALLATWAAFRWSTAAWAFLKGLGFTLSMVIYLVVESLFLRYKIAPKRPENLCQYYQKKIGKPGS